MKVVVVVVALAAALVSIWSDVSDAEVGGSGCEEVTCKARQICISHAESGKVACIRKKLLMSRYHWSGRL